MCMENTRILSIRNGSEYSREEWWTDHWLTEVLIDWLLKCFVSLQHSNLWGKEQQLSSPLLHLLICCVLWKQNVPQHLEVVPFFPFAMLLYPSSPTFLPPSYSFTFISSCLLFLFFYRLLLFCLLLTAFSAFTISMKVYGKLLILG